MSTEGDSKRHGWVINGRWQRFLLLASILGFVGCFQWAYINWLSPLYGFYGYTYFPPPTKYLALAWFLSVMPSLWMPLQITRPSQLAYWVLYLTVMIPSMFIPLFIRLNEPPEISWLMLAFFVGFALTGMSYKLPLLRLKGIRLSQDHFWWGLALLGTSLTVWVAVAFRKNIHLVGFGDIYDIRSAADDVLNPGLNYALRWLYGAINPLLLAYGLYHKRPLVFFGGVLGQFIVYLSFGTKASILCVVFIAIFSVLLRGNRIPFALKLTWGIIVSFVGLFLLNPTADAEPGVLQFAASLIFGRMFGLPGLLTGQYFYFFQHNPLTFYSHLKLVNLFVAYPYKYILGTEVGYYYYDPLVDTTAHFWATDGLAALGLWGIPLISMFCAIVFWILDSVARKHDALFASLVISYAIFSLANLSIFTSLLSGGFGLLILFLYLLPADDQRLREPKGLSKTAYALPVRSAQTL